MTTRIFNIVRITANGLCPNSAIDIEGGRITGVYDTLPRQDSCIRLIDGQGCYAAPGFVDIHVHGGGGVEFTDASPERIREGCLAHARHGTTTIVPTSMTAPIEKIRRMIGNVRQAQAIITECTIAGVHLEGPFLSPAQSGAQSPDSLLAPTPEVWEQLLNVWPEGIRIMGVAPELPGAMELGDKLNEHGVVASIAHSDADYDICAEALGHGFSDITHLYSGCSMVHRTNGYRHGGVVEAGLLEDGFTVQVIADGKHLPPELLRLIYKCKGPDKIALITDALFPAAAGFPEGTVLEQSSGMPAVLEDGVMKLLSRQAFAGSVSTMDRLVQNMVQLAGVPLWDAVTMAATTPAKIIGLSHRKGAILPGYDADIVLLDNNLNVQTVMALGTVIE